MTKLYLITGFLGAGKTTFLEKFVRLFPSKRIALIINEFGKNGVDGALLKHLDIAMTEINNGSIFCSCRVEQFEGAVCRILKELAPDMIFVEASGLADPTAVRSIFCTGNFDGLEYAGAICLADAARFHKVYQSAKVSRMQLAVSDLVLINKTDIASEEQISSIEDIARAQKPNRPIYRTSFGEFKAQWLDSLRENNNEQPAVKEIRTRDLTLRSVTLKVSGFDRDTITAFLKLFAEDTYRIKGFIKAGEEVCAVDCVGPLVDVYPFEGEAESIGQLTVLFGNGLPAIKSIKAAAARFPQCGIEIEQE